MEKKRIMVTNQQNCVHLKEKKNDNFLPKSLPQPNIDPYVMFTSIKRYFIAIFDLNIVHLALGCSPCIGHPFTLTQYYFF